MLEALEVDVRAKRLPLLLADARAFDDELRRQVAAEEADLFPLVRSFVPAPVLKVSSGSAARGPRIPPP